MNSILVVDDEREILKDLKMNLSQQGFRVITAQSGEEGWSYLNNGHATPDLVMADYNLNGTTGIDLLKKIRSSNPDIPIFIVTTSGKIEHAVEAIKSGANNYLTLPYDYNAMSALIHKTLQAVQSEPKKPKNEPWQEEAQKAGIIGESAAIREIIEHIILIKKANSNVLLLGESGTGKEVVARAVHTLSDRVHKPFIPVDCAAIPSELMENELFGHEKGAYTGAHDREIGKLELAEDGTLFLDELGELPKTLQVKLLRVLQEREFFRISGKEPRKMKCRVICATNSNLEKDVAEGRFREDLYYRLNVLSIQMPSLRKRREDILPLAEYFLEQYAKENSKKIDAFDKTVTELFLNYNWPGNIRELKNSIERAVVMCPFNTIVIDNLPTRLQQWLESAHPENISNHELHLPSIERSVIIRALEKVKWNQTNAAGLLGISRKQLRTKMKNLKLLKS